MRRFILFEFKLGAEQIWSSVPGSKTNWRQNIDGWCRNIDILYLIFILRDFWGCTGCTGCMPNLHSLGWWLAAHQHSKHTNRFSIGDAEVGSVIMCHPGQHQTECIQSHTETILINCSLHQAQLWLVSWDIIIMIASTTSSSENFDWNISDWCWIECEELSKLWF